MADDFKSPRQSPNGPELPCTPCEDPRVGPLMQMTLLTRDLEYPETEIGMEHVANFADPGTLDAGVGT